jgi:hypothetical protein
METSKPQTIRVNIFSPSWNAKNVETLCGHYAPDFETKQSATYTITNGVAELTALVPAVFKTTINLPLPISFPVVDLGSGTLDYIEIDADTLTIRPATCRTAEWFGRIGQRPKLSTATHPTHQQLMADWASL